MRWCLSAEMFQNSWRIRIEWADYHAFCLLTEVSTYVKVTIIQSIFPISLYGQKRKRKLSLEQLYTQSKFPILSFWQYLLANFTEQWYVLTKVKLQMLKGQLIWKANCQAVNSSKKRTNEFVFTTMRRVFVRFLEEIEDTKKAFRN